jgi:hypothetical protein
MLPLMIGVMASSIISGQIVARTGRYKWMTVGAMALATVGLFLMTGLRADTDVRIVWAWMLLAGIGIGPSFAIFTIVVQSAVETRILGAATSALTFFRQVGGSVGLALAGAIFGSSLAAEVPRQLAANGVPGPIVAGFASAGDSIDGELTGVGVDLGAQVLGSLPAAQRAQVEPFIGPIVDGIHQAFSLAIANALWLGLAGALASTVIIALFVPELTLRRTPASAPIRADATATDAPQPDQAGDAPRGTMSAPRARSSMAGRASEREPDRQSAEIRTKESS